MTVRGAATMAAVPSTGRHARSGARVIEDTAPDTKAADRATDTQAAADQDRDKQAVQQKEAPGTAQHASTTTTTTTTTIDTEALQRAREHIAAFATPQDGRGVRVVGLTLVLWVAMLYAGVWWFRRAPLNTLWGLAVSACWVFVRVGTYVRAFVLMHDATHGALFSKRWMNQWTGIITGLMNAMDAPDYQKTHAQHHALLGIEEEVERDPDLIVLWTTKDWAAWPRGLSKAAARVMCDPLVLFTAFAPVWIMAFNVSWPQRVAHHTTKQRVAYVIGKLLFIPCLYAAVVFVTGTTRTHLLAEIFVHQCALSYAMFLYCVEHTFEGVYRVPKAEFNRTAAGLLGSSYLPMPWWFQWASCGVEYHHFHHLNAKLPCYRMRECEESAPPGLWEAAGIRKLTARDGFRALVLSMWDPDQRCYVPFPEWAWLDRLLAPKAEQKEQPAKKAP